MRQGTKTLAVALIAFALALGVAACGGDDDSGSTGTNAAAGGGQEQNKSEPGGESGKGAKGEADGKSGGSGAGSGDSGGSAGFTPKQHSDSGGGSASVRVKGGDNSVQDFGRETGGAEFEAAAAALHNFLDARAEGNWEAACRYLSKATVESFEKLAAQAKQVDSSSCGAILEGLTNPAAKSGMKAEAAKADVRSLRSDGDRSFLIYIGLEGTILAMPMANEGGEWKVSSLAGTPLN